MVHRGCIIANRGFIIANRGCIGIIIAAGFYYSLHWLYHSLQGYCIQEGVHDTPLGLYPNAKGCVL